ncbi:GABA permease [Blastomyces gilchristii SLH14081]|uniref:GABA permease n=2 Tax=Blastomyces TaxID=229219 RepID=A0A179V2B5_BLAGS|nr:GABA permease [Blastomyces gilchristii SLH14081]OAT13547.1 GABA permease [Blastomyces gilchristii SLH14081]
MCDNPCNCGHIRSNIMHRIQTGVIMAKFTLVIATIIALPVGKSRTAQGLNSGSYVFTHEENLSAWPTGWALMLAGYPQYGQLERWIHMLI